MSGSCLRADGSPAVPGGFSLLELLIVLALVSMMAALVAPRLQRTYEAVARSGERAEAVRQLERLPLLARGAGRAIEIPAGDAGALASLLALPQGWSMQALAPLRIEASGWCHAGRVQVDVGGGSETWALSAPDCGVTGAL